MFVFENLTDLIKDSGIMNVSKTSLLVYYLQIFADIIIRKKIVDC